MSACRPMLAILCTLLLSPSFVWAQRYQDPDGRIRVAPIAMPYSGARNVPELSPGPDYLEGGGLRARLEEWGARVEPIPTVRLAPDEEDDYGEWHRLGLANAHLGRLVAANERNGHLTLGLLANCSSLLGVLGGLQRSGDGTQPRRVGLVFIDAHGDFNTPETTLSGMLGGMPVAVSAGLCLRNLRLKSGLDPALPVGDIVLAAVRDLDPLERELVESHELQRISVADLRERSAKLRAQMERLSATTDRIYVHVDMDVLDPAEVPGHPLAVPDGPTSRELADALTEMFRFEKTAALGIASTPAGERDPDGLSLAAAYRLIQGALRGVAERGRSGR